MENSEDKIIDTIPSVGSKKKETDMITIFVDRKETMGGISINGKRYIGEITVPRPLGREIMRIAAEFKETRNKLNDPSQKIRHKNSQVIENLYLANPEDHAGNPNFSREFGLLDPWQWQFIIEPERKRLKELKRSYYDYQQDIM